MLALWSSTESIPIWPGGTNKSLDRSTAHRWNMDIGLNPVITLTDYYLRSTAHLFQQPHHTENKSGWNWQVVGFERRQLSVWERSLRAGWGRIPGSSTWVPRGETKPIMWSGSWLTVWAQDAARAEMQRSPKPDQNTMRRGWNTRKNEVWQIAGNCHAAWGGRRSRLPSWE